MVFTFSEVLSKDSLLGGGSRTCLGLSKLKTVTLSYLPKPVALTLENNSADSL